MAVWLNAVLENSRLGHNCLRIQSPYDPGARFRSAPSPTMALPSYASTLLILMGAQSLGTATIWIGISTFNVSANNFLQALIVHSPSRETMAQEFMVELGKCEIISVRNLGDIPFLYMIVSLC